MGYTPEYLTTVWIGNDRQEEPMRYKEGAIGGGTAAALWRDYMAQITANRPVVAFAEPEGIVWAHVDADTGQAIPAWVNKESYLEVFAENRVPESTSYKIWQWLTTWPKKLSRDKAPSGEATEENPAVEDSEPPVSTGEAPPSAGALPETIPFQSDSPVQTRHHEEAEGQIIPSQQRRHKPILGKHRRQPPQQIPSSIRKRKLVRRQPPQQIPSSMRKRKLVRRQNGKKGKSPWKERVCHH